ncbi:hypothetical protein BKA64DRAFT_168937 [Cadophora sp. MPI-SDFR-AT-0126]|nr:hypothetical protein BKA64DRAFT_168937 [Leotiomycetes sp. MPI-SDFR-AT-0126]
MQEQVWGGTLSGIQDTTDPFMVPIGSGVIKGPQVSTRLKTYQFQNRTSGGAEALANKTVLTYTAQPALGAYPAHLTLPLPKTDIFRPIQVDYYVGIQENYFWDFNVRNFSHFRPGQILRNGCLVNLVSIRDRQPPTNWQVAVNMQDYLEAVAPANSAAAIFNRLLLMTTADRIALGNAKRKQIHEKYVSLLQLRIRQTEEIWNQVEMMARGDLEKNGYSQSQCLGSLLGSIGEVLGTLANLLTALGDFDTSSAAHTSGMRSRRAEF